MLFPGLGKGDPFRCRRQHRDRLKREFVQQDRAAQRLIFCVEGTLRSVGRMPELTIPVPSLRIDRANRSCAPCERGFSGKRGGERIPHCYYELGRIWGTNGVTAALRGVLSSSRDFPGDPAIISPGGDQGRLQPDFSAPVPRLGEYYNGRRSAELPSHGSSIESFIFIFRSDSVRF